MSSQQPCAENSSAEALLCSALQAREAAQDRLAAADSLRKEAEEIAKQATSQELENTQLELENVRLECILREKAMEVQEHLSAKRAAAEAQLQRLEIEIRAKAEEASELIIASKTKADGVAISDMALFSSTRPMLTLAAVCNQEVCHLKIKLKQQMSELEDAVEYKKAAAASHWTLAEAACCSLEELSQHRETLMAETWGATAVSNPNLEAKLVFISKQMRQETAVVPVTNLEA